MSKVIGLALYLAYIALLIVHWYEKPAYNWDMISYIGAALSYEEKDITKLHYDTYQSVLESVPKDRHPNLISIIPHHKILSERPDFFVSQLNGYQVKPLYVAGVYALHKLGLDLVFSTRLLAILPAIGLAILILALGSHVTTQSAIAACSLAYLLQVLEFNRLNFSPHRTCCRQRCLSWGFTFCWSSGARLQVR